MTEDILDTLDQITDADPEQLFLMRRMAGVDAISKTPTPLKKLSTG